MIELTSNNSDEKGKTKLYIIGAGLESAALGKMAALHMDVAKHEIIIVNSIEDVNTKEGLTLTADDLKSMDVKRIASENLKTFGPPPIVLKALSREDTVFYPSIENNPWPSKKGRKNKRRW